MHSSFMSWQGCKWNGKSVSKPFPHLKLVFVVTEKNQMLKFLEHETEQTDTYYLPMSKKPNMTLT